MEITIWSDFVCPFCYIGQAHLERAMDNFAHADEIII
jgi:predicted DsbA family dithiol-disulfide isomerase